MRICISSNGQDKESNLDQRFGRCEFFNIYDQDKKEFIAIKNKGNESMEGAGIAAAQQIVDSNVDVLITGKLGPNAFKILEQSNIELLSCNDEMTIEDAIRVFESNGFDKITSSGPKHQGR